MAQIYSNENFPRPAVEELRRLGHDVLTSDESGRAGLAIPDEDVLAYAAFAGRILVTLNRRHFIRLHQETPRHSGIVVCTLDLDYSALAQRIHAALLSTPEMAGQLVRINRPM
ncbi:MAG: DUF5615 family PIN-like protein [Planctomycetales bacterium]|nr:DUF5615 family PIN-like protein [Planctomycetales bacterium]